MWKAKLYFKKRRKLFTWDPKITAPSSRNRVKLLVRLKLPVSHLPRGTFSWAPPLSTKRCMYFIAFRNVSVLDVSPSPTPPNSFIDITTLLGGNSVKNPEQLLGSGDEVPAASDDPENTRMGRTDFVEIWRDKMAKTVKRRRTNAHEVLVKAPMIAPQLALSDSMLFYLNTHRERKPNQRRRIRIYL